MLTENSLYTSQAERDSLLKDKKKVMDALCFSLLGFLGCYQLAQNRAFLKTYNQTEGKLQLNSIGDTNHDVSLSVKLAEEAKAIPVSAAMNVTKLLYKIKSKQIKGPLDEKLVRDVIKTLKIQTNRPDTVVYNVVESFEDGTIGLGELAKKLYNLSKTAKFKDVSGEFRTLVMKGQYQELFNKIATTATVAPKVTTTSIPAAAPVATAPAVATKTAQLLPTKNAEPPAKPRELGNEGFSDSVSMNELAPLFDSILTSRNATGNNVTTKVAAWCRKNNVAITASNYAIFSAVCKSLAVYMKMRQDSGDFSYLGPYLQMPKWASGVTFNGNVGIIKEYMVRYSFEKALPYLESGDWEQFVKTFNIDDFSKYSLSTANQPKISRGDLVKTVLDPVHFWKNFKATSTITLNSSRTVLNRVCLIISNCTSDTTTNYDPCPQIFVLTRITDRWGNPQIRDVILKGWSDTQKIVDKFFRQCFDINDPKVMVQYDEQTGILTVGMEENQFSGNNREAVEALQVTNKLRLVDSSNPLKSLQEAIVKRAGEFKSKNGYELWNFIGSFAKSINALDLIKTEAFTKCMLSLIGSTLSADEILYYNDNIDTYVSVDIRGSIAQSIWNCFIEYSTSNKVEFRIWCSYLQGALSLAIKDFTIEMATILKDNNYTVDQFNRYITSYYSRSGSSIVVFVETVTEAGKKFGYKLPPGTNWKALGSYIPSGASEEEIRLVLHPTIEEALPLITDVVMQPLIYEMYPEIVNKVIKGAFDESLGNVARVMGALSQRGVFTVKRETIKDDLYEEMKNAINTGVQTGALQSIADFTRFRTASLFGVYADWAKTLIRDALLEGVKAPGLSLLKISNLFIMTTPEAVNKYMLQFPMQDFAGLTSGDLSVNLIHAFDDIMKCITKNPEAYSVESVIRMAVAINARSKELRGYNGILSDSIEQLCGAMNLLLEQGGDQKFDEIFNKLSFAPNLRTKVADWFKKSSLLKNAINAVKHDAIHALVTVDAKRMNQLMAYNNITIPTHRTDLRKNTLSKVARSTGGFSLAPLAVTEEVMDAEAMDRRTVEYDAFNKYRHGQIGLKFLRSFNVDIPSQRASTEAWNAAHPNATVMNPVFHGTGSVAATFILRYGFSVVKSTDSSVVGRMLGDGIYFSNVLDKAGQYMSDGGYTRGKGTKGYIFQMSANLGGSDDYRSAISNVVSPEWCVFHPNDQLRIYKAHFVELVSKYEIQAIKDKYKLNEDFFKVEQFKDYLREDLQDASDKGCISYTFMDGNIPISEDTIVDFEKFDPAMYGPHVTLDTSGLGPVVYITVDDPNVNEIYAVRYTSKFMNQGDDFARFLDLLRNKTE